ncbi:hypothetical protein [Endozoicomonas sp.]|uniref:hypothetical protein n=1 Tax=Endozoicomonas sp. TaxID=1892382 RepID=UPI0028864119|nr:transporter substrate-binding domain-containing protein [Endozoicomonas sp.]
MQNIATLLITLLFSSHLLAQTRLCKEVVLTGHPDLPPVSWGDFQNTRGAAAELITDILEQQGISVINDYFGGANRVNHKLQQGIIHINPAMSYQQKYLKDIQYIEPPIYTQSYMVVTRKDRHMEISQWSDMKKLKGVAPKNLRFSEEFNLYSTNHLNLVRTFNAKQGLKMLNVGRVDYAIYPQTQGDLFMSLLDFEGRFEKMPVEISSFELHTAISRKLNCQLPLQTISNQLQKWKKSGYTDKVINDSLYKWMDFSLEKRNNTSM